MQHDRLMRRKTFIREWRIHRGLSQEQVASGIGMSTPNLSRLERGLIPYSQTALEALAELFGAQPYDLLSPPSPEMTDAPNRIKELRKLASMSQGDVAALVGTTTTQISRLEQGHRQLTQKWMDRIAPALGCKPADLLLDGGGGSNVSPGPETIHYLPLISWVQAGAWAEVQDPYEPGDYERLVPVTRRYSNRAYALKIKGDSMQASDGDSFPDGSIICVEPNQDARNGSYVVMKLEESQEATFKQLVIDGDRRYLKPLNQRYPIIEITGEAVVCGVVRQLVMDFGG